MRVASKTDIGNIRENNEDVLYSSAEPVGSLPNLFLVADGMGGHKAGEIASGSAKRFFLEYINMTPCSNGELLDYIAEAVKHANKSVYDLSLSDPAYYGMGTTLSVCVIADDKVLIAHVGDSRIYLSKNDTLMQLTNDHTFVGEMVRAGQFSKEEAQRHPSKNALTRALGVERYVSADAPIASVESEDVLLLCSDGLSNMVSDNEISEILRSNLDVQDKADELIERAKKNGGIDNITVVVIQI